MGAGRRNPITSQHGGEHTGIGKKQKKGPYSKGGHLKEETNKSFTPGTKATYIGSKKIHVKDGFNRIERGKECTVVGYDGRQRRIVQFDGYSVPVQVSVHRNSLGLGETIKTSTRVSKQSHRVQQKENKTETRQWRRETRQKLREVRQNLTNEAFSNLQNQLESLCGGKGVYGFLNEKGVSHDDGHLKRRRKAQDIHNRLSNGHIIENVISGEDLKQAVLNEAVKQGIEVFTDGEVIEMLNLYDTRMTNLSKKIEEGKELLKKTKDAEETKEVEEDKDAEKDLKNDIKEMLPYWETSLKKNESHRNEIISKMTKNQKKRIFPEEKKEDSSQ